MRVLIVSHYFPPEIGAPQARLSDLARLWTEMGEEVTVLTGMPNHPTGVIPPQYRRRLRAAEATDGYRVIRTWLYATPNEGFVKKTLGHLSFMGSSVILGTRQVGRPDVVIVSSPTFFSILSALAIARATRARLVIEVRDLWPAIFVELGVLTNRRVIRALERLELAAYDAADAVVVVSEGFRRDLISRGVPAAKVHTIRNGVDLEAFGPVDVEPQAPARLGASNGQALVLYIGAHGISHGLTSVVDAAALLRDERVHFAFVGEGAGKKELEQHVAELGVDNVTLLPGVPHAEVPGLLAAADICLVPLRDVPLFSTFIPSKIFEYFAAGRAVIGAVRGEAADILRAGGSIVVEPEDAKGIAEAVRELAANAQKRAALGDQARAYVSEHFDRRALAGRYRELLRTVVDG
jgi:glycosyltransferase involved in cell wall biosynthesis